MIKIDTKLFFLIAVLLLGGLSTASCSSTKILKLNAVPEHQTKINGLNYYATPSTRKNFTAGKREVKIAFFHGMGWTEKEMTLASDFTDGIYKYYDLGKTRMPIFSTAGPCEGDRRKRADNKSRNAVGGVKLKLKSAKPYSTDLKDISLVAENVGCVDRQILEPENSDVRFIIYRLFWDNVFWNDLQVYHIGWDDAINLKDIDENFRVNKDRKKINRVLKDEIVNYGFADATLYLGGAGENIRNVVENTICIAALDSISNDDSIFNAVSSTLSIEEECAAPQTNENMPISFVAESLGSRALFDVLRAAHFDGSKPILNQILQQEPEVYLLANQIPLLGLGNLKPISEEEALVQEVVPSKRAKLVAISEVNDPLTYEIVPYIHQLASIRELSDNIPQGGSFVYSEGNPSYIETNKNLEDEFGFDVVDARMKFAKSLLGFIPFVSDPTDAHTGHAEQDLIMKLILCGAAEDKTSGRIIVNSCKQEN